MTALPQSRVIRYLTVALRWFVILAVVYFLASGTVRYAISHLVAQVYTATATIQVPASDLAVPSAGSRTEPLPFNPEFESVMRSPDCLLPVIRSLGLDKTWADKVASSDPAELADVDALTKMEKVLTFRGTGTDTIEIKASSEVPEEAAAIANAVADRYKAMRDAGEDQQLPPSPVAIVRRAEVPTVVTHPNPSMAYTVTVIAAGLASLVVASFVEIVLLFLRAGERVDN